MSLVQTQTIFQMLSSCSKICLHCSLCCTCFNHDSCFTLTIMETSSVSSCIPHERPHGKTHTILQVLKKKKDQLLATRWQRSVDVRKTETANRDYKQKDKIKPCLCLDSLLVGMTQIPLEQKWFVTQRVIRVAGRKDVYIQWFELVSCQPYSSIN